MCYDQPVCKYFRFNPVSGEDKCVKPRCIPCTADLEADAEQEYYHNQEWDKIGLEVDW